MIIIRTSLKLLLNLNQSPFLHHFLPPFQNGIPPIRHRQLPLLAGFAVLRFQHALLQALAADDDLHGGAQEVGFVELDARAFVAVVEQGVDALAF